MIAYLCLKPNYSASKLAMFGMWNEIVIVLGRDIDQKVLGDQINERELILSTAKGPDSSLKKVLRDLFQPLLSICKEKSKVTIHFVMEMADGPCNRDFRLKIHSQLKIVPAPGVFAGYGKKQEGRLEIKLNKCVTAIIGCRIATQD